ncbi:MAG TPA: cytochrome c biogenesis protein CcdA [Rhodoglobus sp.]|nr:cytochrome c biogenesis protein CcdA [Rhodoglobus sp.]
MGPLLEGGNLLFALPIALAAGLLSFLSPCVLPLVPGYLGYVTGSVDTPQRRRTVLGAALFVLGFSVVFLLYFAIAGSVGFFLVQYQDLLLRIGGALVILMGLVFIGQVTFLQRTVKPGWQPVTGLVGAPLLGAVFAVGWTPCIGPTMLAITTLASTEGDLGRALLLGAVYCIGLGVPFLLVAIGFGWVGSSIAWVKRHIRLLNIIGGGLLIAVGTLMVTGLWRWMLSWLGVWIGGFDVLL